MASLNASIRSCSGDCTIVENCNAGGGEICDVRAAGYAHIGQGSAEEGEPCGPPHAGKFIDLRPLPCRVHGDAGTVHACSGAFAAPASAVPA